MAPPAVDLHDEVVVAALGDLRRHRKARRLGDWHFFDALYKAYLAAIAGGLAVTMVSGLIGDEPLGAGALGDIRRIGPGAIGVVIALVIASGLRSGARGGPVALEAAEVRHVLLAPVDRDIALRAPARRQLRFTAFLGSVLGAVVGLLAFRRLPGGAWPWILSCGVVGGATAMATTGAAMVAAGRRLGRGVATSLGAPLVVWSAADALTGRMTSPTSLAAQVALWPLDRRPTAAVAALLAAVALAAAGLSNIGGLSLEAAERRGRLVSHLRFAATFQDLRTVMLLRRQLGAELPRAKPWIELRPAVRGPVTWRRDWRGILRWPGNRLIRLAVLGVVAGLATAAAWAGTTPMIAVAGAALFVAGLDAIEGLAQEVDHPDRQDAVPMPAGALHLRHLAAPTVVLAVVGLFAVAAAAAAGDTVLALQVGLPLVVPGAAVAAGAAAVSALRQPPDPTTLLMDSTGMRLLVHHAFPPALATLGPAATWLVRFQLGRGGETNVTSLALTAGLNLAIIAVLILGWVRQRDAMMGFFAGGGLSQVGK